MLINNIPWLVHQDSEVLSFNGERREFFFFNWQGLVLKPLYSGQFTPVHKSTCFAKYTYINNLDTKSICQICLLLFDYKVNCSITLLKKYV